MSHWPFTLVIPIFLCTNAALASELLWLGTPTGSLNSQARLVSSDGSVVAGIGSSESSDWRWTKDNGFELLVFDVGDIQGLSQDGGVIVGGMRNADDITRAFRWTADDGLTDLGALPGDDWSRAVAISADGTTVFGWSDRWDVEHARRPFRWTAEQGMAALEIQELEDFGIEAASWDGSVVTGNDFRWSTPDSLQQLGKLPGTDSAHPNDISADGSVIVGNSGDQAFRWTASAGIVTLGSLPGEAESRAEAVSADGIVAVGASPKFGPSSAQASVWDPVHGVRDLKEVLQTQYGLTELSDSRLVLAWDISADRRTIVGVGDPLDPQGLSGAQEGWVVHLDEPIGPPLPEDGDYNANGMVEQADLDLVLLNWGQTLNDFSYPWINEVPTSSIGQAQLDAVLLNWGAVGMIVPNGAAAVPEPAAGMIGLLTLLALAAARKIAHPNRG